MNSDHLIDTKIKMGTCNRCQAYVYLAMASGVRSAADITPANRDAYVAALLDGRRTFGLIRQAGSPSTLATRRVTDPAPTFTPEGRQDPTGAREVLVEHGCGGHARNMLTFTEVEQGPPRARVTPGSSHAGGNPQQAAHESGLHVEEISRLSPVELVSHPRSKREEYEKPRCGTCNRICKPGTYWGIQHGHIWIYVEHEECP